MTYVRSVHCISVVFDNRDPPLLAVEMSSAPSYVDVSATAVEHCEGMAQAHADLADRFYNPIAEFCQKKLWHQLTERVLEFMSTTETVRTMPDGTHSYLALYDKVVLKVDSKLNTLSLARIAAAVSNALSDDHEAAKAVLENFLTSRKDTTDRMAIIYAQSSLSLLLLKTLQPSDKTELAAIKEIIRTNSSSLSEVQPDKADTSATVVYAAHYEQALTFYKLVGPPEAFYEQAMNFLSYAPLGSNLSSINYQQLAVDLCLAALTGDGVYNLVPVLEQGVLQLLVDTPDSWMVEMLQACADGDVASFRTITSKYSNQIKQKPALANRASAVEEKLVLLALVRTAFAKDSRERTLTFEELSTNLSVPVDDVERIVMRAVSVGLINGLMDQVDQTVQVSWVLPRSLNSKQLQDLASRYGEWAVKVSHTRDEILKHTPTFA